MTDFEKIAGQKSLEVLAKMMPTSIAVLDENFRVHYVNDHLAKMLGFPKEEAYVKRCYELTGKHEPCPNCAARKVFMTGEKSITHRTQTKKDGTPVYMEIHDIPIVGENGYVEKVMEVLVDQTKIVEYQKRLERDFRALIDMLVYILESKDTYTARHSYWVKEISMKLARKIGLTKEQEFLIEVAGMLHDIGKVGIPYSIINKKSRLTDEEYELIKTHPDKGRKMVENFTRFERIDKIICDHHERYDGKGYPNGIMGTNIPLEARILAVADSFHAMASRRSYRNKMDSSYVEGEFMRGSGSQFDPNVVACMLDMIRSGELDQMGG